ncbi:hypothetical protein HDV05_000879 [Chytridiales sp. JEL 0842]|nr:hypothetical protein HDV05_000879 [Chytridiales sp. JEL 0842]
MAGETSSMGLNHFISPASSKWEISSITSNDDSTHNNDSTLQRAPDHSGYPNDAQVDLEAQLHQGSGVGSAKPTPTAADLTKRLQAFQEARNRKSEASRHQQQLDQEQTQQVNPKGQGASVVGAGGWRPPDTSDSNGHQTQWMPISMFKNPFANKVAPEEDSPVVHNGGGAEVMNYDSGDFGSSNGVGPSSAQYRPIDTFFSLDTKRMAELSRQYGKPGAGHTPASKMGAGGANQGMNTVMITPLGKKFPHVGFLHEFLDPRKEREYERWFWKRNRKSWMKGAGFTFLLALCYYVQFFVVYPIEAKLRRDALEINPNATCGCYTHCSTSYNFLPDIAFLMFGNCAPLLACFLTAHYLKVQTIAPLIQYLSGITAAITMSINIAFRAAYVEPNGDPWFRAIFGLCLVFTPMLLKLTPTMTLCSGGVTVTLYGIMFFANNVTIQTSDKLATELVVLFYLLVFLFLGAFFASRFEKEERNAFMINLGLVRNNDKLRNQLSNLQRSYQYQASDMDSPLEKSIMTLKSVLANPNLDVWVAEQIQNTIQWLSTSENLFTPSFDRNENSNTVIDDEQEAWLLELLPKQQRKQDFKRRRGRTNSISIAESNSVPHHTGTVNSLQAPVRIVQPIIEDSALESTAEGDAQEKQQQQTQNDTSGLLKLEGKGAESAAPSSFTSISSISLINKTAGGSTITMDQFDEVGPDLGPAGPLVTRQGTVLGGGRKSGSGIANQSPQGGNVEVSLADKARLQSLLNNVGVWNWQIFDFESIAPKPLYTLGLYIFHKAGLMGKLNLPLDKLRHFLLRIEAGYHDDIPYHNATHACDVLHATNFFVNTEGVQGKLCDTEILAAYIAAIIHDYDHPGVNNQFMITTVNAKAILYNDRSVLENHHLAASWQILLKDDSNFLAHLTPDTFKQIREQVIEMVLATDLTGHFAMLSVFKNKVLTAGNLDVANNKDDRNLFWKICIKCADVSNMTKNWDLYQGWLNRIMEEFFKQGDDEKRMGLPVSPFMDRETVQIPSSQISFMDFICLPMYEPFTRIIMAPELMTTLHKNRETLVEMREREKKPRAFDEASLIRPPSKPVAVLDKSIIDQIVTTRKYAQTFARTPAVSKNQNAPPRAPKPEPKPQRIVETQLRSPAASPSVVNGSSQVIKTTNSKTDGLDHHVHDPDTSEDELEHLNPPNTRASTASSSNRRPQTPKRALQKARKRASMLPFGHGGVVKAPRPLEVAEKMRLEVEVGVEGFDNEGEREGFVLSEVTMKVVEVLQGESHRKLGFRSNTKEMMARNETDTKVECKRPNCNSKDPVINLLVAQSKESNSSPQTLDYSLHPKIRISPIHETQRFPKPFAQKSFACESDIYMVRRHPHIHPTSAEKREAVRMEKEGSEKYKRLPFCIRKLHHPVERSAKLGGDKALAGQTKRKLKERDVVDEHRVAWVMHSDEPESSKAGSLSALDQVSVKGGETDIARKQSTRNAFEEEDGSDCSTLHVGFVRVPPYYAPPSEGTSDDLEQQMSESLAPSPHAGGRSVKLSIDDAIRKVVNTKVEERQRQREARAFETTKPGTGNGMKTEVWINAIERSVWASPTRGSAL